VLFKTNRAHNFTLPASAIKSLKNLKIEFDFLREECKHQYLFGKSSPLHSKTLLRIVNEDLAKTCQLCNITDNITSHSFRISVISKLLKVTTVQNVGHIIGHQDIRSIMCYDRYRLSKSTIQKIYGEAKELTDFIKK
jgi:site-specific recombinase XerD